MVRGTVVKESPDQVFVDLGFTVLGIPRSSILSWSKTDAESRAAPSQETLKGIYSQAALAELSVKEAVARFGEGVVVVKTPNGLGSGFIIHDDGFIVTNAHVVQGEVEVTVTVFTKVSDQLEKKVFERVRIVAVNPFVDVALLKIEPEELKDFRLTKVFLGNIEDVKVGETVFAVGAPHGFERTVSEGIVSTKTRQLEGLVYIQTTAAINPGNSGGPLFNRKGEVVGVNSLTFTSAEGLHLSIPIDYVQHFLNNREAYAFDRDNPNSGHRYLPPPRKPGPSN